MGDPSLRTIGSSAKQHFQELNYGDSEMVLMLVGWNGGKGVGDCEYGGGGAGSESWQGEFWWSVIIVEFTSILYEMCKNILPPKCSPSLEKSSHR